MKIISNLQVNFTTRSITILSLVVLLASCSKPSPPTAIYCKDAALQEQLLKFTSNLSNQAYLDSKITNIVTLKKLNDGSVNCQAFIDYSHKVIPSQKYRLTFNFTLSSDGQVTAFDPKDPLKFTNYQHWLSQLPQIMNSQTSRGGNLSILQTLDKNQQIRQQLYLNTNSITFAGKNNFAHINISKSFNLADQDVFLINLVTPKQNNQTSYLLAIHSESQFYTSPKFTYQDGSFNQTNQQISFWGIRKYQFSESNDYPIYRFQNNKLSIIQTALPLTYYQHKFATLNAAQLLKQIKTDGCLNGDQFYASDICSNNVAMYCFKFNSISKPKKDNSYWLLQSMCLNHYEYSN